MLYQLDLSTPEHDFSLDSPLFCEALRARFLEEAQDARPLCDEELDMLNAAGTTEPEKPPRRQTSEDANPCVLDE